MKPFTFIFYAILLSILFPSVFYAQATYVVNSVNDVDDGTCNASHCSLREAMKAANSDGINSNIHFNLSGSAPFTISPATFLPGFSESGTTIDGSTQSGWSIGTIIIDGSNMETGEFGPHAGISIHEGADNCKIFGLQIQNFESNGIQIGSYVNAPMSNYEIGAPNKENVIILNELGILCTNAANVLIQNNYIGTDVNFNKDKGNRGAGIDCLRKGSVEIKNNIIGLNKTGLLVYDSLTSAIIENNYIGTNPTGTINLGNTPGQGLTCGTVEYAEITNNVIGFNEKSGVRIEDVTSSIITSNYIGTHPTGLVDMGHTWYGIQIDGGGFANINNNTVANSSRGGIIAFIDAKHSENSLFCNDLTGINSVSDVKAAPRIDSVSMNIHGVSEPGDTIEVFLSGSEDCNTAVPCQGKTFLGRIIANAAGNWSMSTPNSIDGGDVLTATATNGGLSSEYAPCFVILPDECRFAAPLSINSDPCSTSGIVLDLTQLSTSNFSSNSTCQSTFVGNDAWYQLEVPATGNLLVRTNTNNTVAPVVEAYIGTCNQLVLQQCQALDSIPFSMIFEGYSAGRIIYLRVWDKDNTVVNSGNTALLHLTAHQLAAVKNDWVICDYENNIINGNPTILSERDANNYILEYDENATTAEIAAIEQDLISKGETLKDACLCKGAPLQLWGSSNPVDLEVMRIGAKKKANVDTTNYNYIFETVEFQVNSYAIGQQVATDVAMDSEGNFAMVWTDEQRGHNYGRVYKSSGNPITQEFKVGVTDKIQYASNIAMNDAGIFTAVWHEIDAATVGATFAVYGRQYNADGSPKGQPFEISRASEDTNPIRDTTLEIARYGVNPKVDMDNAGNFAVVWHVGNHIFAQRYTSAAYPPELEGDIILVGNSGNNASQPHPAISMNNNRAFIVVWSGLDDEETGIFAQRYDNNGNPVGAIINVNTHQPKAQSYPDVALQDDGSFIIAWESLDQEGNSSNYDIYGQRFDANGNKIGNEFLINSYTTDAQRMPSISLFNDGTFAVAWSSRGQDGFEEGIYAKIFDANGNPIQPSFDDSDKGSFGEEFRMNTFSEPEQERPKTATNGSTILIGAWEDGANDGSFKGIFAQRYEVIDQNNSKLFYSIGTATPSTLLGDRLNYPNSTYNPSNPNKKVKVAVIDTGIEGNHPHLTNAIWTNTATEDSENCVLGDINGYDFVNETGTINDVDGHGTKVNGIMVRGFETDIQLELMNLKFHHLNKGSVFDAICAIYYAVDNGAKILNLSWGFEASEFPTILNKALQYASDRGVLIITTAGNTSKNNDNIFKYPANLNIENMIVVTAYEYRQSTNEIRLANYASFGRTTVDIAAYGYVEAPAIGGILEPSAGTSLAAPMVARTAAIIKGLYPTFTAADIKDCILSTAKLETAFTNLVATGGILDHEAALDCAAEKSAMTGGANCQTNLSVNDNLIGDGVYQSDNTLTSAGTIPAFNTATFKAAQSITLLPNFTVEKEATFHALIENCTSAYTEEPTEDLLAKTAPISTIEEEQTEAIVFEIFPNPASTSFTSKFYLPQPTTGAIQIFNLNGHLVQTKRIDQAVGWQEIYFNAIDMVSGLYVIQLQIEQEVYTKRLVVNRL